MAALQPAVDRIAYLITGNGKVRTSPATISGIRGESINSYQKCIGRKQDDGTWRVNDEKDSMTTNRHVRALCAALDSLGIPWESANEPESASGERARLLRAPYSKKNADRWDELNGLEDVR